MPVVIAIEFIYMPTCGFNDGSAAVFNLAYLEYLMMILVHSFSAFVDTLF